MKNAKKILSILLCLLMLLTLASCKKEEAKTEEDGEKDGTAAAIAFSITANDTTIELGKDATPVLTALGAPMAQSSVGNCGGKAGTWTRYTYAGFYLLVLENGDQQTVDQIELKDDSILTAKGVGIGSTRDDVLKAYGQGYDKSHSSDTALIWRQGNRQLEFYFENGIASAVNFVNK